MLPGSCLSWGLHKRYISLGLIGPSPLLSWTPGQARGDE